MCALMWAPLAWSAPPNDAFINAQAIDGVAGTVAGTNVDATVEAGEPNHGGPGGASVWYRWTAPSGGTAIFDLCGPETSFDSRLASYSGNTLDKLTSLRSDDDGCGGMKSTISFNVQSGASYLIAVDGYFGDEGNFALRWRVPPVGSGDPRVSGEPEVGVRLTATGSSWSGIEPIQRSLEWQRCHAAALVNIAPGKPSSAESFDPSHPPGHAVDGVFDSYWSAGTFAPQAIDIDLRGAHPVRRIRLHVSQLTAGQTVHRVLARTPRSSLFALQHTFSGPTADGQVLEFDVPTGSQFRQIRVATDGSPSWVGWREIEVLSTCRPTEIQSGDSYLLTPEDVGFSVRVLQRASNAGGEAATESVGTAAIRAAQLPVNTARPALIGNALVGESLLAFEGGWFSASPLTTALLWQRCARGPVNCTEISDQTGRYYEITRRDLGSVLRIVVTMTNAAGSVRAESAPRTVVTGPRAPARVRCIVPRLRLKTVPAARRALNRARCRLGRVSRVRSRVRRGRIVSQSRRAGRRLPVGTRVNVVVSRGR
jgi:hypothetical protein